MLFIALCICISQAAAVVLEKGNVSIGQLTVPEIEDKLQVLEPQFFSYPEVISSAVNHEEATTESVSRNVLWFSP